MLVHINGKAKTTMTKIDDKMEQMHALDIRINQLYELHGDFALSESTKVHRSQIEVHPDEQGWFHLKPNSVYVFETEHEVVIAKGEAGWIKPRSTLTRNGLNVISALYDAGYKGSLNGQILNSSHKAKIKKDTRIGQFLVVEAETLKLYDGDYQKQGGTK